MNAVIGRCRLGRIIWDDLILLLAGEEVQEHPPLSQLLRKETGRFNERL